MADVFTLKAINGGSTLFNVDDSGNVTAAGTITITGVYDIISEANTWSAEQTFGAGAAFLDADAITLGTGDDDSIAHNGTDTIWTHTNGDLIFDNTDVNDPTAFRLGTDTAATGFEVRNDSDAVKFKVDGAGAVWVNGGTLDMSAGASDLFVPDNNATALRIREKTNSRDYIIIDTGDASESITFGDAAVNPTFAFVGTGAITMGGALTVTGGITGTALAADESVVATVACANATGGATDALLTIALKQRDNSTALASARQVVLASGATQYAPDAGAPNASLTLGTVTAGSIVATMVAGAAWLVETDATGAFACTATNTDDETVYFMVQTATGGVSDLTKRCVVVGSNSDGAAWSA